ncbi:uncharacterized protein TNCV_4257301 [Trichonephila clavipes]|nr:uncharacterized protein TNCV_4257301 [Trichonephila clavipes]
MKNEEPIHIPDFNFVASYKRPEVPAAGVAIYQHTQDTSHIVTSYMDIHTKFTRGIGVNVSDIGEICIARCNSENGQYILMVAVYISPEKSMQQIEQFLFENLMIYTKEGSELLEKDLAKKFDDIPMILSGDFNINFADDKNLSLIEFLNETLGLTMSNDRKVSTTKYKTTIDAVFIRYLDKFQSNIFISYFSYHKPIVSFLEYNEMIERTDNLSIVEINDVNDVNNENNVQT